MAYYLYVNNWIWKWMLKWRHVRKLKQSDRVFYARRCKLSRQRKMIIDQMIIEQNPSKWSLLVALWLQYAPGQFDARKRTHPITQISRYTKPATNIHEMV